MGIKMFFSMFYGYLSGQCVETRFLSGWGVRIREAQFPVGDVYNRHRDRQLLGVSAVPALGVPLSRAVSETGFFCV